MKPIIDYDSVYSIISISEEIGARSPGWYRAECICGKDTTGTENTVEDWAFEHAPECLRWSRPVIRCLYSDYGDMPHSIVIADYCKDRRGRGWYCITPNGVAHGPYSPTRAFGVVRQWLRNFVDPEFWNREHCG